MQGKFAELKEKYEDLSLREQVMLVAAVAAVIGFSWFQFLSEPMYRATKQTSTELSTQLQTVEKLRGQYQSLDARRASDPHRDLKDRIVLIDQSLAKVDQQLAEKFHGLIEPRQMAEVLESVLKKHSELKLLSVRSLASVQLIQPKENLQEGDQITVTALEDDAKQARVEVFRHGLQIEFEGNYLATLNYLKTLEALDWEFYWDAVQLDVTDYPKSRVIITVHTLSLRDSWIGV